MIMIIIIIIIIFKNIFINIFIIAKRNLNELSDDFLNSSLPDKYAKLDKGKSICLINRIMVNDLYMRIYTN